MILYRKESDSCYFLNTRGMPLGIALPEGVSFEDSLEFDRLKLKKDDILVIYTDGITEAMNKADEQFGNDRLIQFIKTNNELAPEEFTQKLDSELHRFTGGAPQGDDITLVVIKEKMMLDEVVFEKRKRLLEMVENEGVPLEEACKQMGVSPSTYYKYRRRWQKLGDVGLLNKKLRADSGLKQISYETRKEILKIVRENPDLGTKRLIDELAKKGIVDIDQKGLYEELGRMRLNTRKLRLEYIERVGGLTPEMSLDLEKEILKEQDKIAEIDRDEYLLEIKKSLGVKKEQLTSTARDLVEKLQKMEPVLGDTSLYGDIASELGKLRGGEDISKLFENIILKMANMAKESAKQSESLPADEAKPLFKLENELADKSQESVSQDTSTLEKTEPEGRLDVVDLSEDKAPIDVIGSATPAKDISEEKDDFDWEGYSERLSQKFKKK